MSDIERAMAEVNATVEQTADQFDELRRWLEGEDVFSQHDRLTQEEARP